MQQIYEQKLLKNIEQCSYENAILVSGKPDCIPDILLLIESLQINVPTSYQIIYFYYQYTDDQLEIIKRIFPSLILADIEQLMPSEKYLEAAKLLCNNYFGPPLAIKFYSFKLLKYFKNIIYLDRDTYVLNDFTEILNWLTAKNFDFAALPNHDAMALSCKPQIEEGQHFIRQYHTGSALCEPPKTTLINGGVLFLSSSLLRKVNFEKISSTIVDICQLQNDRHFACTDEDIMTYIINTEDIQFIPLPDSCNFIFGFHSLQHFPTCRMDETSDSVPEKIYVLHMCSSDKRSPLVSSIFPEIENGIASLLSKLRCLCSGTASYRCITENLIAHSLIQDNRNRISHLMKLRNNLFYRYFSYELFNFLNNNQYFYTEKIQNDAFFFIFIRNVNQATRFFIASEFFSMNFIEVTFRIYILHSSHSKHTYLKHFNASSFKEDFINIFSSTSIAYDERFIYMRYHVPKEEFITSLKKLEILFNRHRDDLYMYIL